MNIDYYILAFSSITVVVTIWMGFRSAKTSKTASDFFVAGRSVSVGWNASAISGEYLSAASFMGIAGMVMSSGYDALWYPVCYACGYLFLLLFIAGPLRRFGAYTIPDFAEGRYDSPVFRKIAVCFVLFIGFFYTMPQMKGAGTTLAYIFPGLPYWAGVVLVGAVITLNVALGGMKGITLVQAFQYWAKMFAISVPIFVLIAVYGHYGKQLEANSAKVLPIAQTQERFFPQTWQITAINGNSNELYLKYSEIKTDVSRHFGGTSYPLGDLGVFDVLREFSEQNGFHRMLVAESAQFLWSRTNKVYVTARFSKKEWQQDARASLRSNGVDVIVASSALIVVPTAKQAEYEAAYKARGMLAFEPEQATLRKPLPEKAPKDETWLSPFGPLTTKAAKAAAAVLGGKISQPAEIKYFTTNNGAQVDKIQQKSPENHPSAPQNQGITGENQGPAPEIQGMTGKIQGLAPENEGLSGKNHPLAPEIQASTPKIQASTPPPASDAAAKSWLAKHQKPYSLLYTYSLIIALICGTAGLPHILVRFYTNPDGGAAKRTTMWVMILIGIFYVFPPVFGVMGRNLFPELYNGIGAKGTDKIVLELPRLLNEKFAPLGSILSGITCAGAFAAFMSTFSGLLVSMTGALAHDVYGRMLRPKATPEQRMRMFKFAAVLIGFVSILLGSLVEPLEINFMVGQAFAIAAASYFPLLFMSVWWRGMTMRGAAVGMLTGGLCALVAATLTNVSNLALDKGPMGKIFSGFAGMNDFWAHHPLLRILCEQPAIWTVPLAITLMIVVSKTTRKEVPSDVRMKMLVLHAPEKLGLKQEYIQEHQGGH